MHKPTVITTNWLVYTIGPLPRCLPLGAFPRENHVDG